MTRKTINIINIAEHISLSSIKKFIQDIYFIISHLEYELKKKKDLDESFGENNK